MKRPVITTLLVLTLWMLAIPIVPLCYAIAWLDRKLKLPMPFPRNVDGLAKSEKWCIAVLKANKILPENITVIDYKVTPLNPLVIFRSNAGVIEINYTHDGAPKTLKCFAKFAPAMGSVWNRTVFNMQHNHIKEIMFNRYCVNGKPDVASPAVYYSGLSLITGNLCLITEFMAGCMEYSDIQPVPDWHLNLVIESMSSLHARFWTNAPWAKETSVQMKRIAALDDVTVYLFESMVAFKWSVPARKVLIQSWSRMNRAQTLLHGDARIGNMMFPSAPGSGRFVFIDWQAARKGKGAFDLAYFIILSLTGKQRESAEAHAVESYYNHLVEKGITDYSHEQMEEDYRDACLCVLVLLALPMLSGEVSADGTAAQFVAYGLDIWRKCLDDKFSGFDYKWMAGSYGITEPEAHQAVTELIGVIANRVKQIVDAAGSTEVLETLQKHHNETVGAA